MVGSDGDGREQAAEMDRNAMRLSLDRLSIVAAHVTVTSLLRTDPILGTPHFQYLAGRPVY